MIEGLIEFFNFTKAQKFVLTFVTVIVSIIGAFSVVIICIIKYGYFRLGKMQGGQADGGKQMPTLDAIAIEALLQRMESNLKEWLRDHDRRNHEQAGDMGDAIKRLRAMAEENHAATQKRLAEMQEKLDRITKEK